jgi:hypothetical protein
MINTTTNHLVCFSHLRWDFVYQRPQHLMTRFAKQFKVYFVEEPIFGGDDNQLEIANPCENLCVVTPKLRNGLMEDQIIAIQKELLTKLFADYCNSKRTFNKAVCRTGYPKIFLLVLYAHDAQRQRSFQSDNDCV